MHYSRTFGVRILKLLCSIFNGSNWIEPSFFLIAKRNAMFAASLIVTMLFNKNNKLLQRKNQIQRSLSSNDRGKRSDANKKNIHATVYFFPFVSIEIDFSYSLSHSRMLFYEFFAQSKCFDWFLFNQKKSSSIDFKSFIITFARVQPNDMSHICSKEVSL